VQQTVTSGGLSELFEPIACNEHSEDSARIDAEAELSHTLTARKSVWPRKQNSYNSCVNKRSLICMMNVHGRGKGLHPWKSVY